ncbi:unnamed protein product [Parnassius apollo]|uniref:(apollo) hypothetical protein n=1 Tax=Parnassius apollo TaxID=110799 RepID=A0A8S3WAZ0_PARAO|nr:unnamed protein product [Parnassius apollo]
MLHNSGPFGPNDVPINMGAPVNMTPMSGAMNITNNISNLAKIAQQPSETTSAHYPVPNYPTYGHPHLNMNTGVNPYPNYPPIGYHQSNYIPQNPSSVHDTNWHNGMLPMNLNTQSDESATLNFSSPATKRPETINDYREHTFPSKLPLNVSQVPTKAFHKHLNMENNHYNYQHYTPSQSSFRHYTDYNLDLSTKSKSEMDPRRKSLETTVKLIENILINTTKKSDNQLCRDNDTDFHVNSKQANPIQSCSNEEEDPISIDSGKLQDEDRADNLDVDSQSCGSKEEIDTDKKEENSTIESLTPNERRKSESDNAADSFIQNSDDELSGAESDAQPEDLTANSGKEILNLDPDIEIKVESTSWVDTESFNPFQRDVNGMPIEDATNVNIILGDRSVEEAKESIKNESDEEKYFECPNCNLLFNHPKRFLIHYKWHSFGLTNERRMEMAREKEMKKNMRREARAMQRMTMNELKETNGAGKKYACKDCDKVFVARGSLKNHRQRYHPTRVKECKICGKTVLGWIALRAHLSTHSTDSGYQCNECPKRFKYSHSLAKHKDTHLEKTHGCEQCPKMFGSVKLLKMHMKTHERVLRGTTFHCTYCGKGFFESYSLQVHERTHRNERPFLCEICNTRYGTNSSLKRHLKVSHSTSKPFECPTCHRSFISEVIRERHEQRVHGDPDSFKFPCKECPCKYLKAKDLRKHMYKVHPKGRRKRKQHSDSE